MLKIAFLNAASERHNTISFGSLFHSEISSSLAQRADKSYPYAVIGVFRSSLAVVDVPLIADVFIIDGEKKNC